MEPHAGVFRRLDVYLFGEVTKRFTRDRTLSVFDFFCIVSWKANRAKSKVASRLRVYAQTKDLSVAVARLAAQIRAASDSKAKLAVLVEDAGFKLPIASAILSVLYPNTFTVFDRRVCEVLRVLTGQDFYNLKGKSAFDELWPHYLKYKLAVEQNGVGDSLREKDCHLWGTSFRDQLVRDIERGFVPPVKAE